MMKAVILEKSGGIEALNYGEVPVPKITVDEVLIRSEAISINPVDIKTRSGKSLHQELAGKFKPIILGWDVSGIVEETGSAVRDFKKGDEVFGMVNFPGHGQAYAEYVAAPAAHLALKPKNISHAEAAAATLAALTAWQALVNYGKLSKGQKLLVHAAAGGVGHYAIQIAKHLGAYVIGTASAANRDFVLGLGADEFIDYRSQRLEDCVSDMDLVLDSIGMATIDSSIAVTKKGGTVIFLPVGVTPEKQEEAKSKGIACYRILVKSDGDDMKKLAGLLEKEFIRSHVSRIFPFSEIRDAHRQIETGKTKGKIVLTMR